MKRVVVGNRAGMVLLVVGVAAAIVGAFPEAGPALSGQSVMKVSCIAMVLYGIRRWRPASPYAWWYLVIGFSIGAVRNLLQLLSELGALPWKLSVGDVTDVVLSTLSGPWVALAMFAILRARSRGHRSGTLSDSVVLTVGIGLTAMVLISIPTLQDHGAGLVFFSVGVIAVVRDVATIAPALALWFSKPLRSGPVTWMTVVMLVMPMSSLLFAWLGAGQGPADPTLVLLTGVLGLAQVALAAIAMHPEMVEVTAPSAVERLEWTLGRSLALLATAVVPVVSGQLWRSLNRIESLVVTLGFVVLLALMTWRLRKAIATSRKLLDRMSFLADHDPLTGLPNRRYLYGEFSQTLQKRVEASGSTAVSCCYLDLDNLREVNDRSLHESGDRMLQEMGRSLLDAVSPYGSTVVRIGGDEFLVLTTHDVSASAIAADRVASVVMAAANDGDRPSPEPLSASVGYSWAVIEQPPTSLGRTLDGLIHEADLAQGLSKRSGGRRLTAYDPQLGTRARHWNRVRTNVAGAWDRGEMSLVYQAVVDLGTGRTFGAESLLRWKNPELGQVSPLDAVGAAEELGIITDLGLQILDRAIGEIAEVDPEGKVRIGVNVSGQQLRPRAMDRLIERLLESGRADQIWLEVTEQMVVEEQGYVAGALADLRSVGVMVAIDDFGTGYCGLEYLCTLPADIVKLDGSFARQVTESPERRRVAQLAAQLAEAVGASAVAEGLETMEIAQIMQDLGFRFGQGYALQRPTPVLTEALVDP